MTTDSDDPPNNRQPNAHPNRKGSTSKENRGRDGRRSKNQKQEKQKAATLDEKDLASSPSRQKPSAKAGPNRRRRRGKGQTHNQRQASTTSSTSTSSRSQPSNYPEHWSLEKCWQYYHQEQTESEDDVVVIRGRLRVLPSQNAASFVRCDRGNFAVDVCIPGALERNRAMDGDIVFVQVFPLKADDDDEGDNGDGKETNDSHSIEEDFESLELQGEDDYVHDDNDDDGIDNDHFDELQTWQDDPVQIDLWNPTVEDIPRRTSSLFSVASVRAEDPRFKQHKGCVIGIVPPKTIACELNPSEKGRMANRRLVGSLKVLQSGTILFTPNNKSLPQFKCPASTQKLLKDLSKEEDSQTLLERTIFGAEYKFGSWLEDHKWPPCINVHCMGNSFILEDEIQALITEQQVDHGEFSSAVLHHVDETVQSGLYHDTTTEDATMGWKPTPDMYKGRRDYRSERIFTIDPTTAKDLDDALHIKDLGDGRVEVGVHIADVSFFVRPETEVDKEAQRRATTVYLVDRTIPMLPRPLCEIACSLNENVERLAFSCVWKMNLDGTLACRGKAKAEDVWYGRTVIKSCARLDYASAQNIIDGKVATGETEADLDDTLWPKARRPSGDHTVDEVAADVRLLHRVGMARRKLRFDNGALALNGIKLTFKLDTDGQTPLLAAPYPIRDSNRLVEEYMLLANYLVAQRLVSHARQLAVLRQHDEPAALGLDKVVTIAKVAMGFDIDISSSQKLHDSLVRFSHESDELLLQCVTNLMMTPMMPAEYFVAGLEDPEKWRHYALNIPYYTHFTSPIRRYPDILVHRLLQATIEGEASINRFQYTDKQLNELCQYCNDMRMCSKNAQERCDRIFLSLYLRSHPMRSVKGVVLSVGISTFQVFIPTLGANAMVFLQEHEDMLTYASEENNGMRRILLQQKPESNERQRWNTMEIEVFVTLSVTVLCRDKPPVDIKLRLEGPWTE